MPVNLILVARLAVSVPVVLVLIWATVATLSRLRNEPGCRAKVLAAIGILLALRFMPLLTPLILNSGPVESIMLRVVLDGLMQSVAASIAFVLLFQAVFESRASRRAG
jgi:hypothetical protein